MTRVILNLLVRRRKESETLNSRHIYPLLGFVLPTLVIGYGFVIPGSCIAGINEHSIGFGTTVLGACLTYLAGIRTVCKSRSSDLAKGKRDAAP